MVKAVIFDMYETLITLHAAPLYFSAEMAADAGVPVEDFRRAWYMRQVWCLMASISLCATESFRGFRSAPSLWRRAETAARL